MAVIDPERWRQLAPLLDHALELTDDERTAWLRALHAKSPELAADVTALFAGEAAADRQGFLDGAGEAEGTDASLAGMSLETYLQSSLGDAYIIERELGGGGMGRVFLAREPALGRTVVIKVLLPTLAAGLRAERFEREVRVAAVLQHPNVVPLFKAGEAGGLPYYVMPYVSGESLRARLTRDGRLPQADAVSVLRDVARALSFAHERGVVHRDVKPDNVLLAGDAAVVTDFGIAKAVITAGGGDERTENVQDLRTLSAVGSMIGTPAYMAPEQVTGGPRVDHRADLYAWGVLAYELLAGSHPFADRGTQEELLAAHLTAAPVPLSSRAPDVSPMTSALVMRCLEKDPAKRPQSAREILRILGTVATPATDGAALRLWPRRWRPATAAIAAIGVLALGLVVYIASRRHGESSGPTPTPSVSLAVLPFEAAGGDTANAYLGEGIADEIATALNKVGGLRVASRTSAAAFRGSHDTDVRELGRRLGVTTVLEGRVRRVGDRMRLTVQLTSVTDGLMLWGDAYERQVKDVFQMQEDIAQSIVGALRARMPDAIHSPPSRAVSSPGTNNPEAYDLYLRGSYLRERRGGGVAKSVEYFERAIAADSGFARAYAGLSYALELAPTFGGPPARAVEHRAMDAASRALALDSTLAEAYTALGLAHQRALRWGVAEEQFRRAIAADPGFAPGEYHYGDYLLRVGRIAEAEEPLRRARAADPLSATASATLAYGLALLGRRDESLAESRRAYELDSSLATVHSRLALAVLYDGQPEQAHALARATLPVPFNGSAAYVLGVTGDTARAFATVRELEARPRDAYQVAPALAYCYLGVGDTARALSALEDALRTGAPIIPLADPMFDPLRGSDRFAAVVRRFGLDERRFTAPRGRRDGPASVRSNAPVPR